MQYHNYIVKPDTALAEKIKTHVEAKTAARKRAQEVLEPIGVKLFKCDGNLRGVEFEPSVKIIDGTIWKKAGRSGWAPRKTAPKELREFWNEFRMPKEEDIEKAIIGSGLEFFEFPIIAHLRTGIAKGHILLLVPAMDGKWKPNAEDVEEITLSRLNEILEEDKP